MTLLEKLEAATEGSRELDALIINHFCPDAMINRYPTPEDGIYVFHAEAVVGKNKAPLPHLTTSIDAALALVGRKYPNCFWSLDSRTEDTPSNFLLWCSGAVLWGKEQPHHGVNVSEELAIMIALVKAEGEK